MIASSICDFYTRLFDKVVGYEWKNGRTSPIICDNLKTGVPSSPLRPGSTCILAVWRSSPSQNTSAAGSAVCFPPSPGTTWEGGAQLVALDSVRRFGWGSVVCRCGSRSRLSRVRRSFSS
jgi:hypothetical protein